MHKKKPKKNNMEWILQKNLVICSFIFIPQAYFFLLNFDTYQSWAWLVVFASVGGRGLTSLETWVQTNWYKHWLVVVSTHGKITGVPNKQGLVFCTDKKYTSIKVCNKDERGTKIIFWTDNQCTFYIPKKTENNFYNIFHCTL
jgi:hypothetical protein